jgi:hypothetical protein
VPKQPTAYLAVFAVPPVDQPEPLYSSVTPVAPVLILPKAAIDAVCVPVVPFPKAYLAVPKPPLLDQAAPATTLLNVPLVELYQTWPSASVVGSVLKYLTALPNSSLYVVILTCC